MALRPARPWTVTPHGPIERVEDNLWSVESEVPGMRAGFPRRMTIARLADGGLLFHNAVPLKDDALEELQSLGRPSLLVVPSVFHCLDAHAFRAKLGVRVLCPAGAKQEIAERVQVDGTLVELPREAGLRFLPFAGVPAGEGVFAVTSADEQRVNLVLNDVLLNVASIGGLWGLLYRLCGWTGGPRVGRKWLRAAVKDRAACKRSIEALAALDRLNRLIPSHGPIVDANPAEVLRALAASIC